MDSGGQPELPRGFFEVLAWASHLHLKNQARFHPVLASCVPRKVPCLAVLKLTSGRLAVPQLGPPTDFPFFKIHRISAGGNDLNGYVPWPVPFVPLGSFQWWLSLQRWFNPCGDSALTDKELSSHTFYLLFNDKLHSKLYWPLSRSQTLLYS